MSTCTFVGEVWVSVCVDECIFTQSLLNPERSCLNIDQVGTRAKSFRCIDNTRCLPCTKIPYWLAIDIGRAAIRRLIYFHHNLRYA